MRQIIKSLKIRPDSGHLHPKGDRFSTDLHRAHNDHFVPVSDETVIDAALKILAGRIVKGSCLSSPREVRNYLRLRFADLQHEVFCLLLLDKRHRSIAWEELFRGTIDGASVHPREVVKKALSYNAAAVILVHNHPSGVAEPSHSDELITQRLKSALELVDIRVLDHLIVCAGESVSLAERGLL